MFGFQISGLIFFSLQLFPSRRCWGEEGQCRTLPLQLGRATGHRSRTAPSTSTTTGRQHINSSYGHIVTRNSHSTPDTSVSSIYCLTLVWTTRGDLLRMKLTPFMSNTRSSILTSENHRIPGLRVQPFLASWPSPVQLNVTVPNAGEPTPAQRLVVLRMKRFSRITSESPQQ